VVEDEPAIRSLLDTAFRQAGLEVLQAGTGQEGIDLFRQHQADVCVVLLDMLLPGTPGQQVLAAIRGLAPDAKVVIMTGSVSPEELQRLAGLGADLVFAKPFDLARLVAAVVGLARGEGAASA
jgi:DNA-binding response OmpR family regulator